MAAHRVADRRHWLIALVLVGVLGMAGCDAGDPPLSIPSTLRTPEIVGVVDGLEAASGVIPIIRLVGGDTYDPTDANLIVYRGTLASGSLLLAGTQPAPWYVYLEEWVQGCYALLSRGRDEGTTVVTEDGLRLTKAPGFSAPHDPGGLYVRPNDQFCLGPDGLVTGYGLIH
jgi:hypothetical protein